MGKKSSSKTFEYVESNYSTLNAHADGVIDNELQLTRLKRFRADRALIKNIGIVLLVLGVLSVLLAIAYNRSNAPVIQIVEKPVYTDKPVYEIVEKPVYIDKPIYEVIKVPDPERSQIIEVPVYIEKIIKVPIQLGAVTDEFSFFHTEDVNINGIRSVTVGASYDSVSSPYPESQWCYADGIKVRSTNTRNRIDLAYKTGIGTPTPYKFNSKDAEELGASIESLNSAIKHCVWYPAIPPIESDGSIIAIPSTPHPINPPSGEGKSGTGFYVNNNGYVITNNHVVDNCTSIWVDDGRDQIAGVVLRKNIGLDIAVIKIDKKTNTFAKFGEVRTGEDVIALGFPLTDKLGTEIKATKGNVSALSGIKGDKDYLQFTAPIQSGNSGGPLLNEGGFVVGINTAKLVGEDYQNINFAIKGSSAQNFLGKYGIKFSYGSYSEPLRSADIVEKGEKFTVRVLCFN